MTKTIWARGAWMVALACLTLFAGGAATAQTSASTEEFAPLVLDRQNGARVYPADERLDLEGSGTLELGVTIPDYPGDFFPQVMTLAAHEEDGSVAFRAQIGGRGTKIGLYTGGEGQILDYDFRQGGFFHIAFAFREDETRVIINDQVVGVMDTGIGLARLVPFYVGGQASELETFSGDIHYVRLWDVDLTRVELRQTEGIFGRPVGLGALDARLILYSQFTTEREDIVFAQPSNPARFIDAGSFGQASGTPFQLEVPPGYEIKTIGGQMQGQDLIAFNFTAEGPDGQRISREIKGTLAGTSQEPKCDANGNCTVALPPVSSAALVDFESGMRMRGLAGTLSAQNGPLSGLYWVNESAELMPFTPAPSGVSAGLIQLPNDMILAGFKGTVSDKINSIGVLADSIVPSADLSGRWTLNGTLPPIKTTDQEARADGGSDLHGSYTKPDVYTFSSELGGRVLIMHGGPSKRQEFRLATRGGYWQSGNQMRIEVLDEDTVLWGGFPMTRVPAYSRIAARDRSFNEYGGTFNIDHQVPFTQNIFSGYDIGQINPENLQDPTPLRRSVFEAPAPDSFDFFVSYRKIVPFGLLHYPDLREKSRQESQGFQSKHDYHRSMSTSVGFSIGVPKVSSFGVNASVQEKMENQSGSGRQFSLTRDVRTQHALVVDDRYMTLDPYFRSRILDMARDIKIGRDPNVGVIINEFGTHYAHALTVGTVSVDTLQFSNSSFREMYEKGKSIGVKASQTIRGVKVGGEYKHDSSFSDSFNREMEQQTEEISAVGSETQPVPVFLDLRKLDTLLAPPYFSDVVVTQDLRNRLGRAIDAYVASFPSNRLRPQDIWEPYFFEVSIASVTGKQIDTTVDGSPVLAPDVTGWYGDLTIADPLTFQQNTVVRVLEGQPQDAGPIYKPGAAGTQTIMLTASQMCGVGTDIKPTLFVGGRLTTIVGDDERTHGFKGQGINPITVKKIATTDTIYFRHAENGPSAVALTYSAKRLPDLDGDFKEMPVCP